MGSWAHGWVLMLAIVVLVVLVWVGLVELWQEIHYQIANRRHRKNKR